MARRIDRATAARLYALRRRTSNLHRQSLRDDRGALLLALIAQRYQLDLAPEQVVEPEVAVTVKPKNGLKMMVRKRKDLPRRQPPIGSTLGQGSVIRGAFEDPPHDLGESRYRSSCIFTFLRSAPRSGSAWGAMVPLAPEKRGEIGKIADHDG